MSQDEKKRAAALAALQHVEDDSILGIGSGSTVDHFIDALAEKKRRIAGAVSSSNASSRRLVERGFRLLELNDTGDLDLYVDGADEADPRLNLMKGGGGALTREKIIAAASKTFICILDDTKLVATLGAFPLPVEVIPMGRSLVARKLVALGGQPVWRENYLTDNGNQILDVSGLDIVDPPAMETEINQLAGVVSVGIFSHRRADVLLVGRDDGVQVVER